VAAGGADSGLHGPAEIPAGAGEAARAIDGGLKQASTAAQACPPASTDTEEEPDSPDIVAPPLGWPRPAPVAEEALPPAQEPRPSAAEPAGQGSEEAAGQEGAGDEGGRGEAAAEEQQAAEAPEAQGPGAEASLPPLGGAGQPGAAGVPAAPAEEGELQSRPRRIWRAPYRKCLEETDADAAWYRHKRHVLVYTYSGKPVYTRYGSEDGISGTTGALSAIVSKISTFFFSQQHQPDSLRYMLAGDHIFAFVERGPLWLVCISRCGDTYPDLVRLLDRVHAQIISILTAGIERTLQTRPNYDLRNLLGGTDCVVNSIIRWCSQDIYLQMDGYEPLPLPPAIRATAVEALKAARMNNILCGFLMAGHRLLAIVTNRQFRIHPTDLSMILNMVMSSASLRTGESWTPVCLAHLNDKAFAYAYISFVEGTEVGVVFLSTVSDGEQFYAISQQAATVKRTLRQSGCLKHVEDQMACCPVNLCAPGAEDSFRSSSSKRSLAAPSAGNWRLMDGIIHAAYYVPSSQQYFSSSIAVPYQSRRRAKALFRGYGQCKLLLRTAKLPSQICIATDHECFFVSLTADFHIYLAVPRGISTGVIGQFYQWVKSQESSLFLGNLPTW